MPSRWDQWYSGGHPPTCTCVACNDRRLGRLGAGQGGGGRRGAIGVAERPDYPRRDEGKSWFRPIFFGALIIVTIGLIGSFSIHFSQGATGADAVAMVVDNVKLTATCPTEVGRVARFILRPDSVPITSELSADASSRFLDAICDGHIAVAQAIILEGRNIGTRSANNFSPTVTPFQFLRPTVAVVIIPSATVTPTPRQNILPKSTRTPPSAPPTTVVQTRPTNTPASTNVPAKAPSFFESLDDLRKSSGITQPDIDLQQLAERVHALINATRSKNGLSPLALDPKITTIAQIHSVDMARFDYFDHDNLQGLDATARGAAVGYDCIKHYGGYYTFGLAENIYQAWLYSSTTYINGLPIRDWNSQEELAVIAVQGWMDSPGHRENILTDTYDRTGVGVAVAQDGKIYITQNFC